MRTCIDPQSSSCWATVASPIALAYMRVLLSRLVSKRWPSGALSKRCISQPHGCSLLVAWFCQLYRRGGGGRHNGGARADGMQRI
ncbi:hypothetical protein DAI22_02g395900 [Oryza sativa Japonica Group]|nr:hypothetical protein DAI22_02g395900 [Oryza sativa Japonica Group]